jgi:hypothetical protein
MGFLGFLRAGRGASKDGDDANAHAVHPRHRASDRKVPEEARDHLRAVLDGYDRLKTNKGAGRLGADNQVAKLRTLLADDANAIWWSDIAQAELCVADILTEEQFRSRLGGWRRRMNEVVGDSRYAHYIASAPNPATATLDQLRADMGECVRSIYYFYGSYGIAAKSRGTVAKWMLGVAATVLAVLAVLAILSVWHPWIACDARNLANCKIYLHLEYVFAAAAAAVLGSIVSVQRRLQDPRVDVDPFFRYIQTKADRFSISYISPIFGAIFGVVMYGLLASKLLNTSLVKFTDDALPEKASDVAVVLVLAFIAGFAEQLVPDALTRIAARALGGSGERSSLGFLAPSNQMTSTAATTAAAPGAPPPDGPAPTIMSPPTPLEATREAALLGQDPNLASQADTANLQKGVVHDANS